MKPAVNDESIARSNSLIKLHQLNVKTETIMDCVE